MNMIISSNDFMLRGLVRKRISRAHYEKCREECEALTAAENAGRTA
jgi:hypothetical protein